MSKSWTTNLANHNYSKYYLGKIMHSLKVNTTDLDLAFPT